MQCLQIHILSNLSIMQTVFYLKCVVLISLTLESLPFSLALFLIDNFFHGTSCSLSPTVARLPHIQGVFPFCAQSYQDKLQIPHNHDWDKALTEDEWTSCTCLYVSFLFPKKKTLFQILYLFAYTCIFFMYTWLFNVLTPSNGVQLMTQMMADICQRNDVQTNDLDFC